MDFNKRYIFILHNVFHQIKKKSIYKQGWEGGVIANMYISVKDQEAVKLGRLWNSLSTIP